MTTLGFDGSTVRKILEHIESVKDAGSLNDGDYLQMCNALRYLHACVAEPPPPPPVEPPTILQMMEMGILQYPTMMIDLTVPSHEIMREFKIHELNKLLNGGGRLSLDDKIEASLQIIDAHPGLHRPVAQTNKRVYVQQCMDLILRNTDTTLPQLRHAYYAVKNRRLRVEIARLEREIAELDNSTAQDPM